MQKATDDHSAQSIEETIQALHSDAGQGLNVAEVVKRLAQYGYNEIEEKEESLWHRIFRRFWGPIPWMIEVAAILSAVVQEVGRLQHHYGDVTGECLSGFFSGTSRT